MRMNLTVCESCGREAGFHCPRVDQPYLAFCRACLMKHLCGAHDWFKDDAEAECERQEKLRSIKEEQRDPR